MTHEFMMDNERIPETKDTPPPPPLTASPTLQLELETGLGRLIIDGTRQRRRDKTLLFQFTDAIENDSVQMLSQLLEEEEAHVNSTLSYGVTILMKAVRCGSLNVIGYLLEMGADPLPSIRYLMCPQSFAVIPECVKMLKKLLQHLDDSVLRHTEGKNLLYRSTSCSDLSLCEYLLHRGVAFSCHDTEILTRLMSHPDTAASLRMIKEILNLTEDQINLRGSNGFYLLKQSLTANRIKVFYLLLQKGADPFHKTSSGNTLMHFSGLNLEFLIFLYDLGLDINATNCRGYRPYEERDDFSKSVLIMLVVLGQQLNQQEEAKLLNCTDTAAVKCLVHGMYKGDFKALKLKMLCRKCVRNTLWKKNYQNISQQIWTLPLPKPLLLFLDVKLYVDSLLRFERNTM